MSRFLTEEEVIRSVGRLSHRRLTTLVRAELVRPAESGRGPLYSRIDIARIELICDLCEDFEMDDEVAALVLSLVDQLHAVRAELRALTEAVSDQPDDVRRSILAAVAGSDG